MPSIAVNGTDGGVRVDDEGARVGLPVAAAKVRDAEGSFPCLNARGRRRGAFKVELRAKAKRYWVC
jgi:hypothetical protein